LKKRRTNPKSQKPSPAPPAASAQSTPVATSSRQRIIFRLAALILAPLVAFAALEFGLRLAGYGYDPAFFKKVRIGNADFLVNNDKFIRRFFPPGMTRQTGALRMEAQKPPGVCRIFIMGESAALGDPDPSYGAGRYMKALLSERFPGRRFEVINVSITAINSYAILPIAQECARHDGDFWIIYMGNNEMIGPFGAAARLGSKAPPRWVVRLTLAIQQWRIGQLLASVTRDLKAKSDNPAVWVGMELFAGKQIPLDDPSRKRVYQNFQDNLRDILRAGIGSGAKVILNTVAVNLKDFPPFASSSSTTNATDASSHQAMNEFLQAHAFLKQGNTTAARDAFQQACDDDALPFRADSKINDIIRRESANFAGPNLVFCDPASPATLGEDPGAIPGDELFYEHVHFKFEGNYRLGRAWAEKIAPLLPSDFHPSTTNDWASQEKCDALVGLTDWNRVVSISEMIQRRQKPPLTSGANDQHELSILNHQLSDLRQRMDEKNSERARAIFEGDVQRDPDDLFIRFNYSDFLEAIGDAPEAIKQLQHIDELLPDYYVVNFEMGRTLEREGKLDEAAANFRKSLALYPTMAMAWSEWFELGNIAASKGKFAEALDDCEHARTLESKKPSVLVGIGRVLMKMNRHPEAEEKIRAALALQPNYFDSHLALAEELAATGRNDAAETEFAETLNLKSDSARPHLELGELLLKEGKLAAAHEQFQQTLQIDPRNATARKYLSQ
jgi:tetratricopeptide (TPR) repeat protein